MSVMSVRLTRRASAPLLPGASRVRRYRNLAETSPLNASDPVPSIGHHFICSITICYAIDLYDILDEMSSKIVLYITKIY
jgi:hypothetical protein